MVNLSSYNSDFLSGLFADVAKANVSSPSETGSKRVVDVLSPEEDSSLVSTKRIRMSSLDSCLSRSRASCLNLVDASYSVSSPTGVIEFQGDLQGSSATAPVSKQDSLAFQLGCVSEASASVGDFGKLAFPKLPATISDSSCSTGLTRASLVRQASSPENDNKDSFGWFVDLDDNQTSKQGPVSRIEPTVSSVKLAFQAQTAPKGMQDDAELKWAQAADTVDDVLRDIF